MHVSRVAKCVEEGRGRGGEHSGTREESLGRTAEAGKEAETGRGGGRLRGDRWGPRRGRGREAGGKKIMQACPRTPQA